MSGGTIYGDWGSTRLRLWRGGLEGERLSGPGIVGLTEPAAQVLAKAIAPWLAHRPQRIILCGMAGARGGLHEAPYAECPADTAAWGRRTVETVCAGVPVLIAAGLACRDENGRSDVMRGEETQVFGVLRLRPELARGACSIVHPGTHGKWIRLDEGRIGSFRTFPTGEMFALLQRSSLAGKPDSAGSGSEDEGFEEGVALARSDTGLLGSLFHTRAGQVRDGRGGTWAAGYLSGLLLGNEVAEMRRVGQLPERTLLIGEPALVARYARALDRFGVAVETAEGDDCVLAGLEMLDADG